MRNFSNLAKMEGKVKLISKFRGCIQGVLIGDCCGAPYEGELVSFSEKKVLARSLDILEGKFFKAPFKKYTDDTAMTKALLVSLIGNRDFNQLSVAKEFTEEYFKDKKRGYGAAVGTIFKKLKNQEFENFLIPAKEQFDGSGSFGNGAAMRVSPVALFCSGKPIDELQRIVKEQSVITHTHRLAIDGAILQALAIQQAIDLDPNAPLIIEDFLFKLENDFKKLSKDENDYGTQISKIRNLIQSEHEPSEERVINELGHTLAALYSVPTAIYCFLRSEKDKKIPQIESENPFRKCLEYSIGLGGDADTIASMACGISGAFRGESVIPENLLRHCEEGEFMSSLADDLYLSIFKAL